MRSRSGSMISPDSMIGSTKMPSVVPQSVSATITSCETSHQTAGQVAGIGRLQSGIGQTLAGAVRGDEVLQHVQAFAEVGGDGRFDDLARGLGHQAAHTGKLADLLFRTARAGVGHDVNRIEVAAGAVVLFHGLEHFIGNPFGDLGPDFDDLVVALAVGDGAVLILAFDGDHFLFGVAHQAGLFRRARPCRRCRSKCRRGWRRGSRGS